MDTPTPADRMALAACRLAPFGERCESPCKSCRFQSAAVAHEIAQVLRERHGGSSTTADWLDGVGGHG